VQCPPASNPCHHRRCPAYPTAKCVVDPCDCRKHTWYNHGKSYSEGDCYYGERR
jgi:hypothetical protein